MPEVDEYLLELGVDEYSLASGGDVYLLLQPGYVVEYSLGPGSDEYSLELGSDEYSLAPEGEAHDTSSWAQALILEDPLQGLATSEVGLKNTYNYCYH